MRCRLLGDVFKDLKRNIIGVDAPRRHAEIFTFELKNFAGSDPPPPEHLVDAPLRRRRFGGDGGNVSFVDNTLFG